MNIDLHNAPLSIADLEKERESYKNLVSSVCAFGLVSAGIFGMTDGAFQLVGFTSCIASLFATAFISENSFRRIDFISDSDAARVARWADTSDVVRNYVSQVATMNRSLVYAEFVALGRAVKSGKLAMARKPLYCNY